MSTIEIKALGDTAMLVSFGHEISERTHWTIQKFIAALRKQPIQGIVEWVPAYCTVAIYYCPELVSYPELVKRIQAVYDHSSEVEPSSPIVYEIPVFYGSSTGPDLSYVADYHQLSEEKVIELHTSREYLIYMIGFVPGFPYLGGLVPELAVPRLEHPRVSIAAGSVGIGGSQTGIYPAQVPSGWRIIGITPVNLVDFSRSSPFLFTAGNYIKFTPIDVEEFRRLKQFVQEQRYKVKTYSREKNECDGKLM